MIEVKDVHFGYPNGIEVLKGVSLTFRKGEFVAIMGRNGAGKTTLVKHFNGLLKPTKGKVVVDGANTNDVSVANLARKVGLVFQNPDHQLFCETVEEEVAFALRNFGFEDEKVKSQVNRALDFLDLAQHRQASPFMLSGGERKRVAMASVLAWNPEAIIVDEPTIGQDYRQKEKLRDLMLKLKAQRKTVVIVSHDVEFVAECNPRVVVLEQGEVFADGSSKRILTDLDLIAKASILPPEITQIFIRLKNLGFPTDITDFYEAENVLRNFLEDNQ